MERMKVVLAKEKRPLRRDYLISKRITKRAEADRLQRSRVGDYPQLRGGVVNIGLDRESTGGVSSATVVVVFIANDVVVVDGTLLVTVAHGGEG